MKPYEIGLQESKKETVHIDVKPDFDVKQILLESDEEYLTINR